MQDLRDSVGVGFAHLLGFSEQESGLEFNEATSGQNFGKEYHRLSTYKKDFVIYLAIRKEGRAPKPEVRWPPFPSSFEF